MICQAIILAGGLGTRLGKITNTVPKPMLLVNGRPFLEYLVLNLKRYGVKKILFSTGYLAEKISTFFGDGSSYGLEFTYVEEKKALGTGGAIKLSASLLEDEFLVLNGDSLFDIDYRALENILLSSSKSIVAIALNRVDDTKRYGRVVIDGKNVKKYIEKGQDSQSGLINAGVYVMKRKVLDFIPEGSSSLEDNLFSQLVDIGLIIGHEFKGYFVDIGMPVELKNAQFDLPIWSKKNDLFHKKLYN